MAISDDIRQLVKREQDIQGVIGVLDTYLANKSKARQAFKPAVAKQEKLTAVTTEGEDGVKTTEYLTREQILAKQNKEGGFVTGRPKKDSSEQNTSTYKQNLITTLNNKANEIINIYGEEDGNELINNFSNQINEMPIINSSTFTNTKNMINNTAKLELDVFNVKTNEYEKVPTALYLNNRDDYNLKADITAQNKIIDERQKERSRNLKINIKRNQQIFKKLTKNYENELSILQSNNESLINDVFDVQEKILKDTYLSENPSFNDNNIVVFSGKDAIDKVLKSIGVEINEENRTGAREFIENKQREFYKNPSQYIKDGGELILINDRILPKESDIRMIMNLNNPSIYDESISDSNDFTVQ